MCGLYRASARVSITGFKPTAWASYTKAGVLKLNLTGTDRLMDQDIQTNADTDKQQRCDDANRNPDLLEHRQRLVIAILLQPLLPLSAFLQIGLYALAAAGQPQRPKLQKQGKGHVNGEENIDLYGHGGAILKGCLGGLFFRKCAEKPAAL